MGATPRAQQIGLLIGVVTATIVVGLTIRLLDHPPQHLIGSDKYPAPQATLMATLIQGLLAFNLDWQFVLVGVSLAVTMELCGVKSLSFAVGAYLPLSTTAPVFVGGAVKRARGAAGRAGESDADSPNRSRVGAGSRQPLRDRPGRGRRGRGRRGRAADRQRQLGEGRRRLSLEHALAARASAPTAISCWGWPASW